MKQEVTVMGQEFELKFAATEAQQDAIRAIYGPWTIIEMETTYFDTPSHAFSARHITARRRLENGVSICTVKTPLPDGSRGEWECECEDLMQAFSTLCKLSLPESVVGLAEEGLITVCGARFTRHACVLKLENATLELALDKGVLLGGSKEIPLCEVEVELKDGSREAVTAFAAALADNHGLVAEHKSKFRRAMILAEGE